MDFDASTRTIKNAIHPALEIFSVTDIVCPDGDRLADLDGIPIYKAGNASHLDTAGSRELGRAYLERQGPLPSRAVTVVDKNDSDTPPRN
jgi:hypothetical protein